MTNSEDDGKTCKCTNDAFWNPSMKLGTIVPFNTLAHKYMSLHAFVSLIIGQAPLESAKFHACTKCIVLGLILSIF